MGVASRILASMLPVALVGCALLATRRPGGLPLELALAGGEVSRGAPVFAGLEGPAESVCLGPRTDPGSSRVPRGPAHPVTASPVLGNPSSENPVVEGPIVSDAAGSPSRSRLACGPIPTPDRGFSTVLVSASEDLDVEVLRIPPGGIDSMWPYMANSPGPGSRGGPRGSRRVGPGDASPVVLRVTSDQVLLAWRNGRLVHEEWFLDLVPEETRTLHLDGGPAIESAILRLRIDAPEHPVADIYRYQSLEDPDRWYQDNARERTAWLFVTSTEDGLPRLATREVPMGEWFEVEVPAEPLEVMVTSPLDTTRFGARIPCVWKLDAVPRRKYDRSLRFRQGGWLYFTARAEGLETAGDPRLIELGRRMADSQDVPDPSDWGGFQVDLTLIPPEGSEIRDPWSTGIGFHRQPKLFRVPSRYGAMPPGTWRIEATCPGFETLRRGVEVVAGTWPEVELVMQAEGSRAK